ncbi:MAG: thioredoxin family protein [Epsilonproteobacteria bacterium]|nr:thioredoxin family protein [Campylobacterota bacterium]
MIKIIFLLLITLSSVFAGGIKWEKDYASALKQSKALNKPIMFVISNHNCHFCVQFESTALSNPNVIQKLNSQYVAAIVYVDQNPIFPKDLYVGGTPATWFLKSDGEPLFEPLMGAVDTTNFLKALDIVSGEYKKISTKK